MIQPAQPDAIFHVTEPSFSQIVGSGTDGQAARVGISDLSVNRSEDTLRIQWKAAGNVKSKYLVEYSAVGEHWQNIALDYGGSEIIVDASRFAGGPGARVRVTAYAGLSIATAISEPFAVPTKTPVAHIVQSKIGRTFERGAPMLVRGFAYDAEDGSLPGDAMAWSIDGYGEIGRGDWVILPELPAGTHVVRMIATDREQKRAEATVNVQVVERKLAAK